MLSAQVKLGSVHDLVLICNICSPQNETTLALLAIYRVVSNLHLDKQLNVA